MKDIKQNMKQQHTPKIQRNDLCICGSGKKYKKCCLKKFEEPSSYTRVSKKKETRDERLKRELMSFGTQSINHKAHVINRESPKAKGNQSDINIHAPKQGSGE